MEEFNILCFAGGWLCGYIIRGFFSFVRAFGSSAVLVEKSAQQSLKLLGSTVYNVSFVNELYKNKMMELSGMESGKIIDNELEYEFNLWKKEAIDEFVKYYPESYKYQLDFIDWDSAMNKLTDIYKKEKMEKNGVQQK